jgi:hypothetical protein
MRKADGENGNGGADRVGSGTSRPSEEPAEATETKRYTDALIMNSLTESAYPLNPRICPCR